MTEQGNTWKSYDGREVGSGEVLVPQLVSRDYARSIGAVMDNLRTWSMAGVRFLVMFVPVPLDMVDVCWKTFNADVNELLDARLGPGRGRRPVESLDALMEENRLPEVAVSSAEAIAMEGILLDEMIAEQDKSLREGTNQGESYRTEMIHCRMCEKGKAD